MKPPSERTRPPAFADLFHDPDSDAPLAAMLNLLLARAGILGLPPPPARGRRPADARRLWPSGPDRAGRLRTFSEHFLAENQLSMLPYLS